MFKTFDKSELKKLFKPKEKSSGEDNGQITVIGGSKLFHGAPLYTLKIASRIVDMVFFATYEKSVGYVAENLKSKLLSFIWIPWGDLEAYIAKSDAILIGPGLMRYGKENQNSKVKVQNGNLDGDGKFTRDLTENLLKKFPDKKWVIDAGSLQVMEAEWIPEGAILTPNKKEFEMLFKSDFTNEQVIKKAKKYNCLIVAKGPETLVANSSDAVLIKGGNAGMTKGGTGDILAGLIVALLAKNESFLAACAASFVEKAAADRLYEKVGTNYNADDLSDKIPEILNSLSRQ
jgi:NAD(P)H-hydrate epimerase